VVGSPNVRFGDGKTNIYTNDTDFHNCRQIVRPCAPRTQGSVTQPLYIRPVHVTLSSNTSSNFEKLPPPTVPAYNFLTVKIRTPREFHSWTTPTVDTIFINLSISIYSDISIYQIINLACTRLPIIRIIVNRITTKTRFPTDPRTFHTHTHTHTHVAI